MSLFIYLYVLCMYIYICVCVHVYTLCVWCPQQAHHLALALGPLTPRWAPSLLLSRRSHRMPRTRHGRICPAPNEPGKAWYKWSLGDFLEICRIFWRILVSIFTLKIYLRSCGNPHNERTPWIWGWLPMADGFGIWIPLKLRSSLLANG